VDTPWWVDPTIFGSLILAVALVVVLWLTMWTNGEGADRPSLTDRVGPASWDFSRSWGSNLTVIGALLGTIISAGVLPRDSSVSKETFAALNLLFAALIVLGPFIYNATRTRVDARRSAVIAEPQFQGFVWSFLVATAITLWAVLGEIATTFAIFSELQSADAVPDVALWLLGAVMLIGGVLLLPMTWSRARAIIEFQRDTTAQRERTLGALRLGERLMGIEEALPSVEAQIQPLADEKSAPLPSWSVL